MKINRYQPICTVFVFAFLVACSTKKDSFVSRNYHAMTTQYNILYNGGVGFDKGVADIQNKSKNNFWKRLPVEKMQLSDGSISDTVHNANFDLAETKATKAIQKHSMNIGGKERNYQTDEAYLMLGKARYYDQRFVPALDAFNYILYKYPNSSTIHEAKIWREKTNMRLGNDALVIKNLSKLLKEYRLKNQALANANAVLAEAFLNLEEKDSAVAKLQIAQKNTKVNTEKARYRFILGQLYEELGKNQQALSSYQSVIDMNRKADREYVIQAYARKAQLFDFQNGDKEQMAKMFAQLVENRENRPFLDVIYHQMGVYYDKSNEPVAALKHYNLSLKKAKDNTYLAASNYRNLGNMYFKSAEFPLAAKYYDSTLVKLDKNTREFAQIEKVRKNLDDVIKYDALAHTNDSILKVAALSDTDRIVYFGNHIEALKKKEAQEALIKKQKEALANFEKSGKGAPNDLLLQPNMPLRSVPKLDTGSGTTTFYFYNPTTVAFGQLEFQKIWGKRNANGYWRTSTTSGDVTIATISDDLPAGVESPKITDKVSDKYSVAYYLNQIPTDKKVVDSINKERNFAYYQLGVIYKEKFKEYALATAKLEKVLEQNPEEKLVLPTLYNLYKLYQITDANKALAMKNRIVSEFPSSRYAQIISNTDANNSNAETPEKAYNQYYKLFQEEQFVDVLDKLNTAIIQFSGDEIAPKLELLRANTQAKLFGVTAYKKALEEVVAQYPNTEEGKQAQDILSTQVPALEKMEFTTTAKSWKILFKVGLRSEPQTKEIEEKIKQFIADEKIEQRSYSYDVYTDKENFIVIHHIKSEAYANDIINYMTVNKQYTINQPAIIISSDNYRVVQIKKNLDSYLASKKQ
ncbi:tetratricopeptide repeat protein [Flavobacterium sp.]|uniref:type IX secretion system periplasmic lipoprotein PorW/SprE n=1 Tax=Flavobacterium sp. TaxID=239 RepID=UPI00286EDB36|nr:tetratricopeptide repeat protein [Flavobacterium sp.]